MKLYIDPVTVNCRKVAAGLNMLGVPYELAKIDYFAGGHKTPEYLAINPNGELPALVDGDLELWESNAILVYGAELSDNTSAYPKDAKTRADIQRWLLWESGKWFASCYVYLLEYVVKPMLDAEPDTALIDAEAPNFHKLAAILEKRLEGRDWLSASDPTIADIAVAAPMHLHSFQLLPLDNYPNLRAWMTRVEALPCWQASDPVPHLPPELTEKLVAFHAK